MKKCHLILTTPSHTNKLKGDVYELPLVPCPHEGHRPGDHAPPPPDNLVGEHVLLAQDVPADGFQLAHVTVQGAATDQVKLIQHLLTDLRRDLEQIVTTLVSF